MTAAPEWIATEATVTTCRYQSPGLSTLAFGFQTTQKFRITFDYYAHGRLYSGEFQSPIAIPQNERFTITYNPLDPQQNSRASSASGAPSPRRTLIAIGITGSIVLSLLWLAVLRSCH
jgi:hypothetical protein